MSQVTSAPHLRRTMGFRDLLLFVVITSFGLGMEARAGQAGPAGVSFWVLGGLIFLLPLALGVMVLADRYPGEGGLYVWSQKAFGDFAGFITGWSYWVCIVAFLPGVLHFIAGSALFLGGKRWMHLADEPAYFITVSLLCLVVATGLNLAGLGVGKWLHNLGVLGSWLPALCLLALGFASWAANGPVTDMTPADFVPRLDLAHAALWPVLMMSLTGLEAASVLGDEIRDARKNLPPALVFAALLGVGIKVIATLAVLAVLLPSQITDSTGFMQALASAAGRVGVVGILPFVAALVVVGLLGNIGAWSATGSRLPMVAGLDRHLPAAFARIDPRGTPGFALRFQSAVVAVLVVVGHAGTTAKGAYDVLLSMTLIPTFIPFLFLFAAAMKVLRARPAGGWKRVKIALLALGLATTAGSMVLAVIPPPDEPNKPLYVAKVAGLAALLLGVGVLIYFAGNRKARGGPSSGT